MADLSAQFWCLSCEDSRASWYRSRDKNCLPEDLGGSNDELRRSSSGSWPEGLFRTTGVNRASERESNAQASREDSDSILEEYLTNAGCLVESSSNLRGREGGRDGSSTASFDRSGPLNRS